MLVYQRVPTTNQLAVIFCLAHKDFPQLFMPPQIHRCHSEIPRSITSWRCLGKVHHLLVWLDKGPTCDLHNASDLIIGGYRVFQHVRLVVLLGWTARLCSLYIWDGWSCLHLDVFFFASLESSGMGESLFRSDPSFKKWMEIPLSSHILKWWLGCSITSSA